jgi:uncharacterized protein (DUF983 family)
MEEPDVLLMLSGVSHRCPDCADDRLFLPADDLDDLGAFCCAVCGAAVLIDVIAVDGDHDRLPRTA